MRCALDDTSGAPASARHRPWARRAAPLLPGAPCAQPCPSSAERCWDSVGPAPAGLCGGGSQPLLCLPRTFTAVCPSCVFLKGPSHPRGPRSPLTLWSSRHGLGCGQPPPHIFQTFRCSLWGSVLAQKLRVFLDPFLPVPAPPAPDLGPLLPTGFHSKGVFSFHLTTSELTTSETFPSTNTDCAPGSPGEPHEGPVLPISLSLVSDVVFSDETPFPEHVFTFRGNF